MMKTPRECRIAAGQKLKAGAFLPAVSGYALMTTLVLGVTALLGRIFPALLRHERALREWAGQLSSDTSTLASLLASPDFAASCPQAGKDVLLSMAVVFLGRLFISVLLKDGLALQTIAVMREGCRFEQVLSGFAPSRIFRTLASFSLAALRITAGFLFIIPGIRDYYSYRLLYFIRSDQPDLSAPKVLAESRRLMEGNRLRMFRLDTSFAGWLLVTGALAVFLPFLGFIAGLMVMTYWSVSLAAFYEDILDADEDVPSVETDPAL